MVPPNLGTVAEPFSPYSGLCSGANWVGPMGHSL